MHSARPPPGPLFQFMWNPFAFGMRLKNHVCCLLFVGVKGRVGEALAVVLPEELAVTEADVVDLVARATAVRPLPLLWRELALPARRSIN